MINEAIDKLVASRDEAFNLKKLDEYNTYCKIIRLMYRSGTQSALSYAASIDKIIAYVRQGHYAHVTKNVKKLFNAAKGMK